MLLMEMSPLSSSSFRDANQRNILFNTGGVREKLILEKLKLPWMQSLRKTSY